MKKSSRLRTPVLVLASLLVLFSLVAGAVLVPVAGAQQGGFWITGDLHTHTYLTDGSHTEAEVVSKAFNTYGLNWMANSEHGGAFGRNPEGANWDTTGATLFGNPNASKDSAGVAHPNMWRWQSLRDFSFPIIAGLQAQYGNRRLFQSLEWNVPSHEHASVGIAEQGDATQISNFEYTYDQNDLDTSRSAELPKINAKHKDAVAAAAFLQKTFPQSSYIILNHPSRKQAYTAADIRAT